MEKINFITNKLYILSALKSDNSEAGSSFSTTTTNNWETLDINHFLTVTSTNRECQLNCIPVYFSNFMIYEKMHMNIDLLLRRKLVYNWEILFLKMIDDFYQGYINYRLTKDKCYSKYNRISNSLNYFRRSVKSISKEERVININIAFETLLLDQYESNKKNQLLDRIWIILKRKINKKDELNEIIKTIDERNNVIHNGFPVTQEINYKIVYKIYCMLLYKIGLELAKIDSTKEKYISHYFHTICKSA
jgi:hypothetical protein